MGGVNIAEAGRARRGQGVQPWLMMRVVELRDLEEKYRSVGVMTTRALRDRDLGFITASHRGSFGGGYGTSSDERGTISAEHRE